VDGTVIKGYDSRTLRKEQDNKVKKVCGQPGMWPEGGNGMKRFTFALLLSMMSVIALNTPQAEAKTILKLATVTPPHHAYALGAAEFARLVEEGTKGEVVIKVYPAGQLGSGERELLEGLQVGTIDMAVTATGPISNFVENMGVVDLPFLFVSPEQVDKVLDGPIGRQLLDDLAPVKIKGLAFFENGFRNFTNSKRPLLRPEDFKGLKFRTMENPVHLASVRQLGAQAVPMSWGEVYTSLQTHVIDGQENPIAIIYAYKLNEVQKYLSLTGHFYSPAPLTMSLKRFNDLKPEWEKLFLEAALKAAAFERKIIRDNEAKQVEELKKMGMEVSTVNKAVFVEAMAPVYKTFFEKYAGWKQIVEKIRAAK
jgi:tripartite ATP-independent transporter DctP family solute receptor